MKGWIKRLFLKNVEVFLGKRSSFIIFSLIPIFIILLFCLFYFNNNAFSVSVGYSDASQNPLSLSYIKELEKDFSLRKFDSKEACRSSIERGITHICIYFPENFVIENNHKNDVMIEIDTSKKNVKEVVENLVLTSLNSHSKNLQLQVTQNLSNAFLDNSELLLNQSENIDVLLSLTNKIDENQRVISGHMIKLPSVASLDDIDPEKIAEYGTKFKEDFVDFANLSLDYVGDSISSLDNLSDLVSDAGLNSSSEGKIKDLIDDVEANVVAVENRIYSINSSYSLRKLIEQVGLLEGEVSSMGKNVEELSDKITGELDELNSNTNKAISNLKELNETNTLMLANVGLVNVTDSQALVNPVSFTTKSVIPENSNFSSFFPTLLLSLIVLVSLSFGSFMVLAEKKSPARVRNFLTKNSSFSFLVSDMITIMLLVFLQVFFISIIYFSVFLKMFSSRIFILYFFIVFMIAVFTLLGIIIGKLSFSDMSNLLFLFFIVIILFVISGVFLPLELLSGTLASIFEYNPFLLSESVIRKILLFNAGFKVYIFDVLYLLIYVFVFFLVALFIESFQKKRRVFQWYVLYKLKDKDKKKNKVGESKDGKVIVKENVEGKTKSEVLSKRVERKEENKKEIKTGAEKSNINVSKGDKKKEVLKKKASVAKKK